jgi:type I restriction enzyme R subunit
MSPATGMNEAQTRMQFIDPALRDAGWDEAPSAIAVEQKVNQIAPGRVESDGFSHKPLRADYVLMHGGRRIAVVEAKRYNEGLDAGEAQARFYAEALGCRFAFSTNGHDIRFFDLKMGTAHDVGDMVFPTPAELLLLLEGGDDANALEKLTRDIPWAKPGGREIRYYQERAVEKIIRALGDGRKNVLVTLATGTGKTMIAFQLVWKLVQAKWTRTALGLRKPRVLFLADRNILADQAMETFGAFPKGECFRLEAGCDNPPLDRTVYFTLYQTLLGGEVEGVEKVEGVERVEDYQPPQVRYRRFKRDFFDLVIVDECHRGGANDESAWRAVLDYFQSASHFGLTATPKCDDNGSTYEYFGKPVYEYSLAQGIADGFLSPYRVKRCLSTLEKYRYVKGDIVSDPDALDELREYTADEIERNRILIEERDRHFVLELFDKGRMPLDQKAIVFCATQEHAARIANIIRAEAKKRGIDALHYCERVTAADGAIGEQYLREFRNSENTVPTILTTSQKLSTGVDACNVRSIVLLKEVKGMVEFKQIIGRGTRRYDGKPYFTIYDFTGATDKFKDPDWDGPVVCPKCGRNPCECDEGKPIPPRLTRLPKPPCPVCGCSPCICEKPVKAPVKVKLSDGRLVSANWVDRVLFDNEMLTAAEFLNRFAAAVKSATGTSDNLADEWRDMESRGELLERLAALGFDRDKLVEIQNRTDHQACDILDVMMDIAYGEAPITREMRAAKARKALGAGGERAALSETILENYVRDGVWTLTRENFTGLLKLRYMSLPAAIRALGFADAAEAVAYYAFVQRGIYAA